MFLFWPKVGASPLLEVVKITVPLCFQFHTLWIGVIWIEACVIQQLLSALDMPVCLVVFRLPHCKHPQRKDQTCVCPLRVWENDLGIQTGVCTVLKTPNSCEDGLQIQLRKRYRSWLQSEMKLSQLRCINGNPNKKAGTSVSICPTLLFTFQVFQNSEGKRRVMIHYLSSLHTVQNNKPSVLQL